MSNHQPPISNYPALPQSEVPHLTTAQMVEVDRAMMEDYRIELMQMMENAGRNLAHLARARFLDGVPRGKSVLVLAGSGGNGGGALVCARRLHNWGAKVHVATTKSIEAFQGIPAHQLDILQRMGVTLTPAAVPSPAEPPALIIDGIIGYSLRGAPRGIAAEMIRRANDLPAPVLALDVPSGIATDGAVQSPAIRAAATLTLTLALPKIAFRRAAVLALTGALFLADISVPPELYTALGISVGHIFAESEIVQLKSQI